MQHFDVKEARGDSFLSQQFAIGLSLGLMMLHIVHINIWGDFWITQGFVKI